MFDIGWTELLVIAVVAIIVVGPKDLPAMLRSLGRYAGKLRRTAGEFRTQFDEALRESELDELRSTMQDVGGMNPANQIRDSVTETLDPLKTTGDDIRRGVEDYGGAQGAGGSGGGARPAKAGVGSPDKPAARPAVAAKPAAGQAPEKQPPARTNPAGGLRKKTGAPARPKPKPKPKTTGAEG